MPVVAEASLERKRRPLLLALIPAGLLVLRALLLLYGWFQPVMLGFAGRGFFVMRMPDRNQSGIRWAAERGSGSITVGIPGVAGASSSSYVIGARWLPE